MIDVSKGVELGHERAYENLKTDSGRWHFMWQAEKWSEDAVDYARQKLSLPKNAPVSSAILRTLIPQTDMGIEVIDGNLLTNVGIQRMLDLLIAAGGQGLDATHSRMGVGDTATAANASDVKLGATEGNAANTQYVTMNSTYPSRASQTVTWQADFTSGLANFHWQEWGIDAGTTNTTTHVAPLLNHKVEDLGTKTTGPWTLSGAVTIT